MNILLTQVAFFCRPQVLALAKLNQSFEPRSTRLLSFLSQLKAGRYTIGLKQLYIFRCAAVIIVLHNRPYV